MNRKYGMLLCLALTLLLLAACGAGGESETTDPTRQSVTTQPMETEPKGEEMPEETTQPAPTDPDEVT